MKKTLSAVALILIFTGCNEKHPAKVNNQVATDSLKKQKNIDSQMAQGERPDSEQDEESYDEVKKDYLTTYNKIQNIDRTIADGSDTLFLQCKYYCLHDSSLIVPALYDWSKKGKKEFVTHNFASQIMLIRNKDTLLNKTFKKIDFNHMLYEQLQKYAILFSPDYIGYNKTRGQLAIGYSVSIPLSDVGVPAYIVIDKEGNYKVLDEYAKIDGYKK
ncbi:DUF4738 domain-containing protein [Mucilaginibacter sp.]|uniref:DUF4738 domain-containing protein n=1 Tax=Mucilaginibacter sp. TaxID=1882438 RepID=UPI00262D0F3C|nr:DUF4738 domain-containing protein [Mucilaginibacter sp.]MDB4918848.1 hypothetical protein [Mucilaginibacter sp.]